MAKQKGQTTIYKTLHRKEKIEQHESQLKPGVNSGAQNICNIQVNKLFAKIFRHGFFSEYYQINI